MPPLYTPDPSSILITGASGFVGQQLANGLLSASSTTHIHLTDISPPPSSSPTTTSNPRCTFHPADLTSGPAIHDLLTTTKPSTIYMLHGIMSSASESHLALGLRINLDSARLLLDTLISLPSLHQDHQDHQPTPLPIRLIYTSSCAIHGPSAVGQHTNETHLAPLPQTSYGTQKLMIELLLQDYTRRGLLDGRICRLPTIAVRAGRPTGAASSFVSSIVREPVRGEDAVLPVDPDVGVWICSPATLVRNLIHAGAVEDGRWPRDRRVVFLPGVTVTPREMLGVLERVAGREVRARVREVRDEGVERIVRGWPEGYDTSRARALGFVEDVSLEESIRQFVLEHGKKVK